MEKSDYEKQLRKTIIEMDEYLTSQMEIMFSPKPKSFGEINDYQTETGIRVNGGVNGLVALAEHYQKNFENPKINEILERRRKHKEMTDQNLFKILKRCVREARQQEFESALEKWINS